MITTAIALLTLTTGGLPDNASFDYSGLPQLRTATKIDVQTHSVTLGIDSSKEGVVDVASTTVYKNLTSGKVQATLILPRRRIGDSASGQPTFSINATWARQPLKLMPISDHGFMEGSGKAVHYFSDLSTRVNMDPGATYALRVNYQVAVGKAGYEQKQAIVGYLLDADKTVDSMNIAYQYGGHSVFQLPEAQPDMHWQIGEKGAFTRQEKYWPDNHLTFVTYYPGGFLSAQHR